ncbi:MAG: AgmX/PglI C-terminal domain-containing protein [Myxococcota bacterium]
MLKSLPMRSLHPLWLVPVLVCLGCTPPADKCASDRVQHLEACQTACEQGDMPSCLAAAHTFDERFEGAAEGADAEQAVGLYEKACEGGQFEACASALRGLLLGPSQQEPELEAPSSVDGAPARRRAILAKACGMDDKRLCEEASDAFLGVDAGKAAAMGRKACALTLTDRVKREACETERVSRANRAQTGAKACDGGQPGGCLMLGNALVHADRPRARAAYAKECKRRGLDRDGNAEGCVTVYERAALAHALPAAQPSIVDRPGARVLLRSLELDPSRPEQPSPEHVRQVIDEGTEALRACYGAAVTRNPKLTGSLALQFTIDALGEPWNIRESELKLVDVRAVECIKQAAAFWRFPEPNRDTIDVKAHFTFRLEHP